MKIVTILILLGSIAFVVSSLLSVNSNYRLSKRQKANLIYLIIVAPIVGSFVYFIFNATARKNK